MLKLSLMSFLDKILNKQKSNSNSKPVFEFALPYILVLLLGFILADLGTLYVRPVMLPKEAPPKKPKKKKFIKPQFKGAYSAIAKRNIFNSKGKIPTALATEKSGKEQKNSDDGPPTLSRLPLKLLGTIVHRNPAKSIATISLTSQNKNGSWKKDEEVDGIAKILNVERKKVIIRNLNTNKKEFIEIPEDLKVSFGSKAKKSTPKSESNDVVEVRGKSRVIKRSDFLAQTQRLGTLLTQARMDKNIGPDGSLQGYKFSNIKPGSIFEKLGFKAGDVIKGVNGEPVNSPAKAMELFNILKSDASSVDIDIQRNGKDDKFNYVIE